MDQYLPPPKRIRIPSPLVFGPGSITHTLTDTRHYTSSKYRERFMIVLLRGGGGGGGGANGYFFVKLDFEIAVDQQTKTSDRTFEAVPDPNRQKVPAGQPRPYLVQIRPNLAKYPEHAQNPDFRCSTCS